MLVHELCQTADEYSSSVWILTQGNRSSLARAVELLALGIRSGTPVKVVADGIDEAEALAAVCALLEFAP